MFNPPCAFMHESRDSPIVPAQYGTVLPGAVVRISFTLSHRLMCRPANVSHFTATINEIEKSTMCVYAREPGFTYCSRSIWNRASWRHCTYFIHSLAPSYVSSGQCLAFHCNHQRDRSSSPSDRRLYDPR
ncbi:hypothetical protein RSAG8_09812, partial [Rhizoctonia solani AG-8 WAC10335]